MLKILFPDIYINSVFELPILELKAKGIKALVFDIDNTIAPFDMAEPEEAVIELFETLKAFGFKLCLLSNNNNKRITIFNKKLKALPVYKAGKPGIKKLKLAMAKMGTDKDSTAMVGDQVFTDVWCGHRAGLMSIMTAPICQRDQLITKVKRPLEKIVMNIYFKRGGGH